MVALQGHPVSPDSMRAIRALLWGAQGQPPASWKQGFFFNKHQGLGFGLVQTNGGPCGVLASVQAHILAALCSPVRAGVFVVWERGTSVSMPITGLAV